MRIFIFFLVLVISQNVQSQDQMFEICPLKVGENIPDVSLMDKDSQVVELAELTAEKPTVLIFYRGAWCGYCTKHLSELNDIKQDIDSLGFQVIGITVDQPEKLDESLLRSNAEISVYSDSKLEVINAFGLDWKLSDKLFEKYISSYQLDIEEWSGEDHHSLPAPAIYIVRNQVIEFQYVNPNYKVRLKPETLLAILETL